MKFEELNISPELKAVVQELGFTAMTPIQAQSIPAILDGRDVIGQSKTGSGKTAAFTIPILEKILVEQSAHRDVQAMILCPTRELCAQVTREVRKLGRKKIGLQVLECAGGVPGGPQAKGLENGVHIVVGTPGRVLDHLGRGKLKLHALKFIVLDEADRMLDMGFQDEMDQIMAALPAERQSVFFSATFPPKIQKMSERFQNNALMVKIEQTPEDLASLSTVEQEFHVVKGETDKAECLMQILSKNKPESAIIFCNFKQTTFDLTSELSRLGVSVACLNGDLEQRERDLVMAKFRNLSVRFLIATDVAARGIDVSGLDLVVNFDLPQKKEVYTHRVGRTGRAGRSGKAVSIIFEREKNKVPHMLAMAGAANTGAGAVAGAGGEGGECAISDEGSAFGAKSYSLAGIPFHVYEKKLPEFVDLSSKMETLIVLEGRKNKMRPGDILGALTGEAGLKGEQIGKIEIHDFFAFVAVEKKVANIALNRLQTGRIKGRRVRVEWPR
jgi:ATP-independent RNA helicase DbpA